MADVPAILSELRALVDASLRDHLDRSRERLVATHPDLAPLADELAAFVLGGGKRLRPILVLLGHRATGVADDAAVLGPALAVELVHTCALAHDDVIDAGRTRRGRPTVHVAFARRHGDAGWSGPSDRFGEAAAILLGDLAYVAADELFLEARVAADRLLAAFEVFTTLRTEVAAGQYLDLVAATSRSTSDELALTVAGLKSGRYSIARPLEIGATLGAGRGPIADGLVRTGLPLGQAFQIRDDVLGVFGAEDETGKSTASDLAEGKRTLLVAATASRLDRAELERLDELLGRADLTAEDADEIRGLMRDSGGYEATLRTVDALVEEAMRALDEVPIDEDVRWVLRELAAYLVERTR